MTEAARFPKSALGWRDFALAHLGLTVTAALAALTVLHVLVVARFNLTTTLAVLRVADRAEILVSTFTVAVLLSSAGLLLGLSQMLVDRTKGAFRERRVGVQAAWEFIIMLLLLTTMSLLALWTWALAAAAAPVMHWLRKSVTGKPRKPDENLGKLINLILALAVTTVVFSVLRMPWVPDENLIYDDHRGTTLSGQVVGSENGFTALLADDRVQWLRTSRIERREICDPNKPSHFWTRPVFSLFGTLYPECRD